MFAISFPERKVLLDALNSRDLLGKVRALIRAPRVQVPNNHILSKILTYITTILKPSA